jgi:hypothetical protein
MRCVQDYCDQELSFVLQNDDCGIAFYCTVKAIVNRILLRHELLALGSYLGSLQYLQYLQSDWSVAKYISCTLDIMFCVTTLISSFRLMVSILSSYGV